MSQPCIPGLDQLERQTPLPKLADLLAGQEIPAAQPAQPPLKDLRPSLAQLPHMPLDTPKASPPETFHPIPEAGNFTDTVASHMAEAPVPFPSFAETTTAVQETPPVEPPQATREQELPEDISYPIPSPFAEPDAAEAPPTVAAEPAAPTPPLPEPPQASSVDAFRQNVTDGDLAEAILPIVESSLEKALYAPKTGLHTYLEPMLRSTVRRAIAEQMQTSQHFGEISISDRLFWRMRALFSSQTYTDIVFERTHRYQVEEVFLLRYNAHSLISYASHDPSRHANPKKIRYDLGRLIDELKDDNGEMKPSFPLPHQRKALIRSGRHGFIIAILRGRANALVRADLDYALEQIEQRFEDQLRSEGDHLLHVLQPLLEGCLLIQSPPAPS